MKISDLTIEVRDASLARVGQILPADLVGLKLAMRFNNVGGWSLQLRGDHPMVESLRAAGAGIIVTGPSGVILSGPTVEATNTRTADDPTGVWAISGTDDSVILGERLAYPTPTTADVTAQTYAYDERTGKAETIAKQYVDANIGPTAPVARRVTGLTIQTDAGLGNTVSGSARFDRLGLLCADLLKSSGLGFDIVQNGSALQFQVFAPVDRSATIRMDIDNLRLTKTEYVYANPALTRAIVAGQGEGSSRIFVEVSDSGSLAAETAWGRRIETFVDSRNTADTTELTQVGQTELAKGGFTREGFTVTPSDDQTMQYGIDWGLGDQVAVVVNSTEIKKVVTEVAIVVTDNGVRVGATVGDPATATRSDTTSQIVSTQSSQDDRISVLERNEGQGAESVVQYVKNSTGSAMTKGQAVYIAGSNGANINVALAKADAESTSSKTLGLLAQDIPAGGHGYVIVEGSLERINTSGLTSGDAVWLSPTTAGGLVYGLASKPVAPNHMVYIGVVKRVQSNNGSIYVHPQNGFELDELHSVKITTPVDNNILAYDSATSLWTNQTAAQANVSEIGHTHDASAIVSGTLSTSRLPTIPLANGGTGTTLGAGGVQMVPTGTWVNAGSASVAADGEITFSGVTYLNLFGVFTSNYANYSIIVTNTCNSGGTNQSFQLMSGTSTLASSYQWYGMRWCNWTQAYISGNGSSSWYMMESIGQSNAHYVAHIDLYSPQIYSEYTRMKVTGYLWGGYFGTGIAAGMQPNLYSADGIALNFSAASSGVVRVYGFR